MNSWHLATLVDSHMVASDVKALRFRVDDWKKHKAGQHYDLRLTAENGYQAVRAYSVASAPEEEGIVKFGIQLLENGEVSPYLFEMQPGGQVELKGPLGGHFIWDISMPGPLVLIGGGSGMVPLMSMLRHYMLHAEKDPRRDIRVLMSYRSIERVLYKDELDKMASEHKNIKISVTLTNQQPPKWKGYSRRVDVEIMKEVAGNLVTEMPMIYICGPTPFVEASANHLLTVDFNPHEIRTERFGPTG